MDLTPTITAKSDQLNADDLISGAITIKVTGIKGTSEPTQPIAIGYEGDNGKPYKPCKSMRRVLVAAWGANGAEYVGRSMTLYRDNDVSFGGIKVGGIRISHMSHIDAPLTMALTVTRASRKPYTVGKLEVAALPDLTPDHEKWGAVAAKVKAGTSMETIRKHYNVSNEHAALLTANI